MGAFDPQHESQRVSADIEDTRNEGRRGTNHASLPGRHLDTIRIERPRRNNDPGPSASFNAHGIRPESIDIVDPHGENVLFGERQPRGHVKEYSAVKNAWRNWTVNADGIVAPDGSGRHHATAQPVARVRESCLPVAPRLMNVPGLKGLWIEGSLDVLKKRVVRESVNRAEDLVVRCLQPKHHQACR